MSGKRGCPALDDLAAAVSSGTISPPPPKRARPDSGAWDQVENLLEANQGSASASAPPKQNTPPNLSTARRAAAEHASQAIAACSLDLLSGTYGRALSRPPAGNSFTKDGGTRVTGPSGDDAQAILERCSEQGQLALSLCLQQCSQLMLDHDAVESAVVALRTPWRASKNVLQGGAASARLVASVRQCLHKVHRFLEQAKAGMIQQPQLEAAKQNRAAATKSRELRPLLSLLACTDEEPADAEEVETFNAPLLSNEAALEVEQTAEESLVEKVPNKLTLPARSPLYRLLPPPARTNLLAPPLVDDYTGHQSASEPPETGIASSPWTTLWVDSRG